MNIRPAAIADLPLIKELNSAVFYRNYDYDTDAIRDFATTPVGNRYFAEAISDPAGVFLVAEEDLKLVGYINGARLEIPYRKSNYFEIQNLGVLDDYKHRGIGRSLTEELLKLAKAQGYSKLYLNCYSKNIGAIDFYKHLGFEEIDVSLEKAI